MAETSGLKTLNQVVDEFLLKTKRPKDEYFRYEQFAIDGLRELRMLHMRGVAKWAKLNVSAINTVSFPDDYVSFIGICVPLNGQFWFLTQKERIVITTTGDPETQDADEGEGVDLPDQNIVGYSSVGGYNADGYYKIDDRNRRIFLTNCDSTKVVLLYNSSGVNLSGTTTYVPQRIINALEAYILYQDAVYSGDMNMAVLYDRNFINAIDKLKYIESPSLMEFKDALYEVVSSLPQR
jgi:hypothetical protein